MSKSHLLLEHFAAFPWLWEGTSLFRAELTSILHFTAHRGEGGCAAMSRHITMNPDTIVSSPPVPPSPSCALPPAELPGHTAQPGCTATDVSQTAALPSSSPELFLLTSPPCLGLGGQSHGLLNRSKLNSGPGLKYPTTEH
ncbi:E3 ubiquitin-protein ligase DTX3L [Platysternon megacephalum]|uniref:E3 ubiquitin-protein ligase DTX3L n=1 Tax=Platysternon megacephalum TaxID=55544 RepID=A0A4D9DIM9_9SAUR|nr:E3 ubiquitin-protein ligase DTX3L [Platysternon megacephalum]